MTNTFAPFGREQLYAAGKPKAPPPDPFDTPEPDPFDDPSGPAEAPDEPEPQPEDYTPPPAPKTILELGASHG